MAVVTVEKIVNSVLFRKFSLGCGSRFDWMRHVRHRAKNATLL